MIFNVQKIIENLSLKFGFRFERINSSNTKNVNKIKESTIGSIQQANNINNDMRSFAGSEDYVSDIELNILKELYLMFRESKKYVRIPVIEMHNKLGISEGDYVGTVNNSNFINIDNNDYVIKEAGIRFMDNYARNNKPEIDITSLAHSGSYRGQELTGLRLINNGSGVAIGIDCYLCADDLESIKFARVERLSPGEESRNSLGFRYSDTSFSTQSLENLRIVFEYKNRDGFKFTSGRYLSQTKRADGNYNINNSPLGVYFKM